jgi:hypothetical protein
LHKEPSLRKKSFDTKVSLTLQAGRIMLTQLMEAFVCLMTKPLQLSFTRSKLAKDFNY